MELKKLQEYIRILATLRETDAPVVSCYLDVSSQAYRDELGRRIRELNKLLTEDSLINFEHSVRQIEEYIAGQISKTAKGVAVFCRGGSEPFFLALDFRVPLPTWISVDRTPNIYHLVEMKDTYHRYIVLIAAGEHARIVEVNVGEVTRQLVVERTELRERVGREWSKEHYQNHRRERGQSFVREKVKLLERLVAERGHSHLMIAGPPQMTAQIRKALPKSLAGKLVDMVPASSQDKLADVVESTLARFVEQEEQESLALCDELIRKVQTGGLAVVGSEGVLAALRKMQVDALILSVSYGGADREEMVRLAARSVCQVEVVNTSEALDRLGGVGALLRYRDY